VMFEQVVGTGVAVGQGAFGGHFLSPHEADSNAAASPAQKVIIQKRRLISIPRLQRSCRNSATVSQSHRDRLRL
jgi:hypothetical protein